MYYLMGIPQLYLDSNEKIQHIIINLGTTCYKKLFSGKNNDEVIAMCSNCDSKFIEEMYEKEITSLKKRIDDNFIKHQNEMTENTKQIIQSKQNVINELETKIIILKKDFENTFDEKINSEKKNINDKLIDQQKLFQSEFSKMENIIENLEEKTKELKNDKINQQKALDTWIGQRKFSNNTEQGNVGEKIMDDVVNHGLSFDKRATIEDSSQVGGSGDRIIKFNTGDNCMVEVKKKGVVTKEDMDQFNSHVKKDFEENKCQMALFVSLETQQIPKIGNSPILHFENNVGYIGLHSGLTIEEKKLRIESALHEMYERYMNKANKEEIKTDNSVYENLLEMKIAKKEECENKVKKYTKKLELSEKDFTFSKQELNNLHKKIMNNKIVVNEKYIDENMYIQDLIERIKDYHFVEPLKKQTFKKIIIKEMNLNAMESKFVNKKIKYTDIYLKSQQPDSNQ